MADVPPARHLLRARDLADARYFEPLTVADMAQAATDLSNAQLSVQATARVLQALQNSSLLTLLPTS